MKFDDLCNLIAIERGGGATPSSVKKYLTATYKVILRQLELNEEIFFWRFGKFEIFDRPSGDRLMGDAQNGGMVVRYIKPKKNIKFTPSKVFEDSVNENGFKIVEKKKKVKHKTKKQIMADCDKKRRPPKVKPTMEELFAKTLNSAIQEVRPTPKKKKSVRSDEYVDIEDTQN